MKKITNRPFFILGCLLALVTCFFIFIAFYPFFLLPEAKSGGPNELENLITGFFDGIFYIIEFLLAIIIMLVFLIMAGFTSVATIVCFVLSFKKPSQKKLNERKEGVIRVPLPPATKHREPSRPPGDLPPSREEYKI